MRINKSSFPGLKFLESPELDKRFFKCDFCFESFNELQVKPFIKNIFFIPDSTAPFLFNMSDELSKIFNVNLFKKGFSDSYTILTPHKNILHIELEQIDNFIRVRFFEFEPKSDELSFITFDALQPDETTPDGAIKTIIDYSQQYIISHNTGLSINGFQHVTISDSALDKFINRSLLRSITFIMFLNFVDVETKIIGSSGKSLYIENEKVKNDTNFNIKVLDKTWYTTVINSEGFPVKGHLRLQPVGEGRKDRKLIYIEPFEKNGYKREAGILKSKGLV